MKNKILTEKSCLSCKVISGLIFFAFGSFQVFRVKNLWRYYPRREKVFNIFAIGLIYTISAANFNAAYQTYLGKTMQLIEMRPSIFRRLTGNY